MVINTEGSPFEECFNSSKFNKEVMAENCIDALCKKMTADPENAKNAACEILGAYATLCRNFGIRVDWRERANCRKMLRLFKMTYNELLLNFFSAMECPDGRVYDKNAYACPNTCQQPSNSSRCTLPSVENCECPEGRVLDEDDNCVLPSQCGCKDNQGNMHEVSFSKSVPIVSLS